MFNVGELDYIPFYLKKIQKEIPGFVDSYFIKIEPFIWCKEFQCHNNCLEYTQTRAGKMINGYYVLLDLDIGIYRFIRHSIIDTGINKIDITPFNAEKLFFIETDKSVEELPIELLFEKTIKEKTTKKSEFYVYGLYEKNKTLPFYIGKGKDNRMYKHLQDSCLKIDNKSNIHKINKILSIGKENIKPIKIYDNLIDEKASYDIEEILIKKYKTGLTNICEVASPPNHKDKNYFEIYGPIKGYIQKITRAKHQKIIFH